MSIYDDYKNALDPTKYLTNFEPQNSWIGNFDLQKINRSLIEVLKFRKCLVRILEIALKNTQHYKTNIPYRALHN